MSAVPQPPRGFRGVFLWVPTPSQFTAGSRIAAHDLPDALSAFLDLTPPQQANPTQPPDPAEAPGLSSPWVGVVVLGRWMGGKPGDSGWEARAVERVDQGFEVHLGTGEVVVRVSVPGDGILMKDGPYGDILAIPQAGGVVVLEDGEPAGWLPSVRDGDAFDMRGNRAPAWPRRRAFTERSSLAPRHPVPALMLSVWRARPIPQALLLDPRSKPGPS